MLSSSQLKKVRDSLERRGDRGTVRDRAKFRRIARGGPIFDKFMDKAYDRYVKEVGKDKAAARGDGAFLQWLTDFITNGGPEKVLAFVMQIIGMFTK